MNKLFKVLIIIAASVVAITAAVSLLRIEIISPPTDPVSPPQESSSTPTEANAPANIQTPAAADHRQSLSLPISGNAVPELAMFDQAMIDFMAARNIRAGTLAVMRNGIVVLERGYGWQDKEHRQTISPRALMRIASVDKPITAAAIKRLIRQGALTADTKVFPLLDIASPSDPRINDITVQHLIDHQGGWDNAQAGFDPCFNVVDIARALGIPSPADTKDIARYMAGRPLQYTPGTRTSYSNFGYALLRLIVERVSGQTFVSYLQRELGLDVDRSHAFPQDRGPREIWYSDPETCTNVFDPSTKVPCPDGGFNVESRAMAASSLGLVQFLDHYWISGEPRNPGENGYVYWFYGSLGGTFTFVYQRPDGVNIAALFNQRTDPSGLKYDAIKDVMDKTTDSVGRWPQQ